MHLHLRVRLRFGTYMYSRLSVARTLMARLPRLFQTSSLVSWKKILKQKVGNDLGRFFYIENGIFCELIRIALGDFHAELSMKKVL